MASPVEAQAKINYARDPIPELAALNVKGGLRFLATGETPCTHLNMARQLWAPLLGGAFRVTNCLVALRSEPHLQLQAGWLLAGEADGDLARQ